MRYRIVEDGFTQPVQAGTEVVTATFWFTLIVGLLFVVAGVRGRQMWLKFWGVLTIVCCAGYFFRDWIGWSAWL